MHIIIYCKTKFRDFGTYPVVTKNCGAQRLFSILILNTNTQIWLLKTMNLKIFLLQLHFNFFLVLSNGL